MTTLTNCPPPSPSDRGPSYPIVRCNAKERFNVRFVCLSDDVFGIRVHFAGRSTVCLAPEYPCDQCSEQRVSRWVGYVAATDHLAHRLFLVELTAGVMPDVNRYRELWPTLRGREITISRPSMKPTGRLKIEFSSEARTTPGNHIPPAFDVVSVLEKIYGVTKPDAPPTPSHSEIVSRVVGVEPNNGSAHAANVEFQSSALASLFKIEDVDDAGDPAE